VCKLIVDRFSALCNKEKDGKQINGAEELELGVL
jgi:hypothetical protein